MEFSKVQSIYEKTAQEDIFNPYKSFYCMISLAKDVYHWFLSTIIHLFRLKKGLDTIELDDEADNVIHVLCIGDIQDS